MPELRLEDVERLLSQINTEWQPSDVDWGSRRQEVGLGSPLLHRPRYLSGLVPAIQMITRLKRPSASKSKKLQLCMSFTVPSFSSPT